MSWYSDGEPFDEYDPPWCIGCQRDTDYYRCRACCAWHEGEFDVEEDEDDEE